MKLDGRKLQSSRDISHALEELKPEPPLFPSDPERHAEVEEAERWGDEVLQDVPRRIVRWITAHSQSARTLVAREVGMPLPAVAAFVNVPAARHLARKVDANGRIQRAIEQVPEVLDHVDELIERGVIGGEQPNAADFQISTSVRALLTVRDLEPAYGGRPAAELAMRFLPEFGNDFPTGLLPAEWLAPVSDRAGSAR
jgi:glutathione S-transferase